MPSRRTATASTACRKAMPQAPTSCSTVPGRRGTASHRAGGWRAQRPSTARVRIRAVVAAIGIALVAALVIRHATSTEALRRLALVAAVALGIRLAAVTVIYFIAIRTHVEGTFFNDEASFYLAAESLLPNPLDKPLPQGLEH